MNDSSNKRLERTRHERASLVGCVGEPLKRNVMLPPEGRERLWTHTEIIAWSLVF